MWQSTVFLENDNSDQSISEDDDLNEDLPEDHVSLGIPAEKKGGVQILSQLDMLRDANDFNHERNQGTLLQKRQTDTCVEDDVELPTFTNNKASAGNSDEEILSDNEVRGSCVELSKCVTTEDDYQKTAPCSFRGNRKDGVCTWLAANAEAGAPSSVNDNADCALFYSASAKAKRLCKGGQGKGKHKFSIRAQLRKDHLCNDSRIKGTEIDEMKNCLMPAELAVSNTRTTTSMAELLVRVQDENDLPRGSIMKYDKTKGPSKKLVKRNILSTGQSDIADDPECLDSDSSQENEENHQIQELFMPGSNRKTIADQFHEALGAASRNEEGNVCAVSRHTGFGLFGKLQRVMQSEKERDSYFLNKLQEDEGSCFDVKIVSKSLEGKLTVCACSSIENDETKGTDSHLNIIKRKKLTIIFSPRICSDVELDVGALVRVHPPWKEVNVKGKDEITIISTYFSQI